MGERELEIDRQKERLELDTNEKRQIKKYLECERKDWQRDSDKERQANGETDKEFSL